MISFDVPGNFSKSESFLKKLLGYDIRTVLEKYGREGVSALASATPRDSGETAASWSYEIIGSKGGYQLVWTNSHIHNGVPIAIILQYGHGTGTGGYVQGRDYINPAMRPIFDKIAAEAWRVVTSA